MPYYAQSSMADRYITRFVTEPPYPFPGVARFEGTRISPALADVDVPEDAFPRAAREERRVKNMPDFLSLGCWKGVCEDFKVIVEELDPGIHQFSAQVDVRYKDDRPSEKSYYAFKLRGYLSNTVIPERSIARLSSGGNPMGPIDLLRFDDHVEFNEDAIGGRHLWVDTAFYHSTWLMSDELVKRLKKAKIKGLDLVHHRLGRR